MAKEGYDYCMVNGKIYVGDKDSLHPKLEVKPCKEESEIDKQIEAKRKELCDLMDEKRRAYYASKEDEKAKEEQAKEEELKKHFMDNAELWFKLYKSFIDAGFQSNQAFKLMYRMFSAKCAAFEEDEE